MNGLMNASLPPVLVVDDEKNMRLSLKTVLVRRRLRGARWRNPPRKPWVCWARRNFSWSSPTPGWAGMSGYELLARLHARWPDLPVLMITAYATPKLAVEAIKAGAFDYLAKPFAPEELLHALSRCAERHRLLHQNADLARPRQRDLPARIKSSATPRACANCAR